MSYEYGFYVVEKIDGKEKRISPIYKAEGAASDFCDLARRSGKPNAFVTSNIGLRKLARKEQSSPVRGGGA